MRFFTTALILFLTACLVACSANQDDALTPLFEKGKQACNRIDAQCKPQELKTDTKAFDLCQEYSRICDPFRLIYDLLAPAPKPVE